MHVRVCVDCGEEYRPGIAVCADCGGALEDRDENGERPPAPFRGAEGDGAPEGDEDDEGSDEDFTEVVHVKEQAKQLTGDADRLVEAGIPFRLRPATGGGYQLLVRDEDSERALGVLGLLAEPGAEAGGGDQRCPACDTPVAAGIADCPECGLALGDEPE